MNALPLLSTLNSSYTLIDGSRTREVGDAQQRFRVLVSCEYSTVTYIFRVIVGALACILTLGSAYSSEQVANLFSKTYTILVIDDRHCERTDLENTNAKVAHSSTSIITHTPSSSGSSSPTTRPPRSRTNSRNPPKPYLSTMSALAISTTKSQPAFKGPPTIDGPLAEFQKMLPADYSNPTLSIPMRLNLLNLKRPDLDATEERYIKRCDVFKLGYVPKTRLTSPISQEPVCANRVDLPAFNNPFIISAHPQIASKAGITPHHLSAFFAADVTLIVDLTHSSEEERNGQIYATPYCPQKEKEQKDFKIGQTGNQVSITCLSNHEESIYQCAFTDSRGNSHPFQYWRCDQWDQNVNERNRVLLLSLAQKLVTYAKEVPARAIAIHDLDGTGHSAVLATLTSIIADMNTNPQHWNEKTYLERIACHILQGRTQHSPHFVDKLHDLTLLEQVTLTLMQEKGLAPNKD